MKKLKSRILLVIFILFSQLYTLNVYFEKLEEWQHITFMALVVLSGSSYIGFSDE